MANLKYWDTATSSWKIVAVGELGATGPQGIQGTVGATGPQGIQGTVGATGPQGIQGIQGEQGTPGVDGASSTVFPYQAKTTITTGDPLAGHLIWNNATQISASQINISHLAQGSIDIDVILALIKTGDSIIVQDENVSNNYQRWTVSATPTVQTGYVQVPVTLDSSGGTGTSNFSNNHNLSLFVFSAGAQGPQGIQGIQGIQGTVGATGPQGIQGTVGATGPQGIQGTVGATGPQGIQGTVGATGPQGIQGTVGDTGPQGTIGNTGPQGPIGVTGNNYASDPVIDTWTFRTATTSTGLSPGDIRFNNSTITSITNIYAHSTSANSVARDAYFTNGVVVGEIIYIRQSTLPSTFLKFRVSATPTTTSSITTIPVTLVTESGIAVLSPFAGQNFTVSKYSGENPINLASSNTPQNTIGNNGDFLITYRGEIPSAVISGPKASGAWPTRPLSIIPNVLPGLSQSNSGSSNGARPGTSPVNIIEWKNAAPTAASPWLEYDGTVNLSSYAGTLTYLTDGWYASATNTSSQTAGHATRYFAPSTSIASTPSSAVAFATVKAQLSGTNATFAGVGEGMTYNGYFAGVNSSNRFVIFRVDTYGFPSAATQLSLGASTVAVGDSILFERIGPIVRATLFNSSNVIRETLITNWDSGTLASSYGGGIGAVWVLSTGSGGANNFRINNFYGAI